MPPLFIPDLDDALHARLREAAARHRRSLEEEARELLREAGGDLIVDSRPGAGTTMHLVFARADAPAGALTPA